MNVRLTYQTEFASITVLENKIYPNVYECDIDLLTVSDDGEIQNIAFERMKFFLNQILEGSILVNIANPILKTFLETCSSKVVILPELPYDQVVGMTLFKKLNAIMNNHLIVNEIKISSRVGSHTGYVIDDQDDFGEFEKDTVIVPWWQREDLQTLDSRPPIQKTTWDDVNLGWAVDQFELISEEELPQPQSKKNKSSKQKFEIINVFEHKANPGFNPTIVSGGLDDPNETE